MARIEYQTLVTAGACSTQRQLFADKFNPGFAVAEWAEEESRDVNFGVEVDLELCEQFADIFDWTWAAEEFLSGDFYYRFIDANSIAHNDYDDAHAAACEAFSDSVMEADDTLRRRRSAAYSLLHSAYWDELAAADRAFAEDTKPQREVKQAALDAARAAFKLAQARAWFACWEAVNAAAKDAADVG